MITIGSFGFISYNSRDFLIYVLNQFISDGIFNRSACWYHESTDNNKSHFHCWVEPLHKIDTSRIGDKFIELTPTGEKQSIAILPKCKSDWNNAYLYGIHDYDYLQFKGLKRELVNIVSDQHIYLGDFEADIRQAEFFKFKYCLAPYQRLKELIYQGKSLEDIFVILRTPFGQMKSVTTVYHSIKKQIEEERIPDLLSGKY